MDAHTSEILLLMTVGFWLFLWGALATVKSITIDVDKEDNYKALCQVIAIFLMTFLGIGGTVAGAYLFVSNLLELW